MRKLTPTKLRILITLIAMLVSFVGACGLGIRIDPDGMTLKWDWPDNVSAVLPEKTLPSDSPSTTPLAPTD